jgi:hypothetical protein
MRGTTTDVSAVQRSGSRTAAHRHHRHAGRHATTTDAPMRARTSTPMPTPMPCHSSGGCRRTLPLRPCYCAAARRQGPPRSGEYASN